jgi:hypothetical protein
MEGLDYEHIARLKFALASRYHYTETMQTLEDAQVWYRAPWADLIQQLKQRQNALAERGPQSESIVDETLWKIALHALRDAQVAIAVCCVGLHFDKLLDFLEADTVDAKSRVINSFQKIYGRYNVRLEGRRSRRRRRRDVTTQTDLTQQIQR